MFTRMGMDVYEYRKKQEYREQAEALRRAYQITEDFTPLYRFLKSSVESRAKRYFYKYWFLRMDCGDIENELWCWAIELAKESHNAGKSYYFDVLQSRLDSRMKNLVRSFLAVKRRAFNLAAALDESEAFRTDSHNFTRGTGRKRTRLVLKSEIESTEDTAINRAMVSFILDDARLSPEENRLIWLMRRYPKLSQSALAAEMGYKHNEYVRRRIQSVRTKLIEEEAA
ncbi:hypothetical protein [Paenibacillus apii]|uniref:hypothetical protein n=1 Tax=Paenibacillus apii TaxID=1850370 RepID=UPI00143A7945|nr:hypothetical protein [Paenibacillus apii]NJJ38403.1 hypothetical protein [Paenibacillus apii]